MPKALKQITLQKGDLIQLGEIVQSLTGNQILEKHYGMLESRMRSRLNKNGISCIADYWDYFKENEDQESQMLVGLMTTHYTFFFREYVHFETLQIWLEENIDFFKKRYLENKQKLRVWSAACSKGQEVYSLAMFLEEELFLKHGIDFEVVGSDIDQASVNYAINGVYPIKEVNTIPQKYLNPYWKKGTGSVKNYAALKPSLRKKTKFFTSNLLELNSSNDSELYDVIFARNVFIYFSEENVKKIATKLSQQLNPQGALVSGLSEALRFDGWNLESKAPSFYVTAPRSQETSHPQVQAQKHNVVELKAKPVTQSYRVLCVDDSPTIQNLLKKIFAQDPLCSEVVSAMNGKEAREKLDQNKFDLITLDIHMPVMGGLEFLETQYKKSNDPPVLMVSSVNRTDEDLATNALRLGAFDYVEKPAMNRIQQSKDELLTKAQLALRQAKRPQTLEHEFSESIGQKIIVPDASQSLRWIFASQEDSPKLAYLCQTAESEYRSPPLLIMCEENEISAFERSLIAHTKRPIETLHKPKVLRPNHVYVSSYSLIEEIANNYSNKTVSLQFINPPKDFFSSLKKLDYNTQVLCEEEQISQLKNYLSRIGISISDVTPSTSFTSLSLEFFAKLREAKAA